MLFQNILTTKYFDKRYKSDKYSKRFKWFASVVFEHKKSTFYL